MIPKLVDVFNLILEGSYDAQGVGDKAYEKFHISTDEPNLKALAQLQKEVNGKPVGIIDGTYIFLNPKNLRYFGKGVRAIGDQHGNLYVAQRDGDFIHADMGDELGFDLFDVDKYGRFYRSRYSNGFYDATDYYDPDTHRKMIHIIRQRNPQFQIISKF